MKTLIGIVMTCLGVLSGLYVGIYLMFIRGIIQIVQSITPEVIASGIGFGVVRIMFAGFVGWLCAMVLVIPGIAMIGTDR